MPGTIGITCLLVSGVIPLMAGVTAYVMSQRVRQTANNHAFALVLTGAMLLVAATGAAMAYSVTMAESSVQQTVRLEAPHSEVFRWCQNETTFTEQWSVFHGRRIKDVRVVVHIGVEGSTVKIQRQFIGSPSNDVRKQFAKEAYSIVKGVDPSKVPAVPPEYLHIANATNREFRPFTTDVMRFYSKVPSREVEIKQSLDGRFMVTQMLFWSILGLYALVGLSWWILLSRRGIKVARNKVSGTVKT
jgi:hypothetical protein